MTERLDGTVALVTGASSGIGVAAARARAVDRAVTELGRLGTALNNAGAAQVIRTRGLSSV